jgi:hypothetical protein
MSEIDFALNQHKLEQQIELVGTVLWNKANKLGSFEKLTLSERNFVYLDIFESELNNGGLFNFLYNDSGQFYNNISEAFFTVKSIENGFIYLKINQILGVKNIPKDIFLRRFFLDKLSSTKLKQLSDLELEFLTCKEDLVHLIISYVKQHKSDFEY